MTTIKISIRRDQIQFESLPFPDDGNSYYRQAAYAWEDAAINHIERAGYEADVNAGYGKDHTKFRVWIDSTAYFRTTAAEEASGKKVAEAADEAGMAAAIKFAEEQAVNANPD